MKKTQTVIETVYRATEELSAEDAALRAAALSAAGRAYAPYSHFRVGVAVRLADGTVVEGNNQENIAFPSGICAERTALFAAGAMYPEVAADTLALVAVQKGEMVESPSPCGACRQVMLETEARHGRPLRVLLCGRHGVLEIASVAGLLPFWGAMSLDA